MKLFNEVVFVLTAGICLLFLGLIAQAQVDAGNFQIISSTSSNFPRDISGDGRFAVFESSDDLATEKTSARNNADGNFEIFLFDYAQRRIFQITNTKRALKDVTGSSTTNSNIQVNIVNTNPVISNDGRYLAFASNAYSTVTGNTDPANFDGNACTSTVATDCNVDANGNNPNRTTLASLKADGNLEIFLYQIPQVTPVDLSAGSDLPITNLATGTFMQATNSIQSLPPLPGTSTQSPIIRPDNTAPAINDDGSVVAFVSTRDLVPAGTLGGEISGNSDLNREIFVFLKGKDPALILKQVTLTPPGDIINQIYNINPSISGDGMRVVFASTGNRPVIGGITGNNPNTELQVFFANLDSEGRPSGGVQVTSTARVNSTDVPNILSPGRRISRDGRYILMESRAKLDSNNTLESGYSIFMYDSVVGTNNFRRVGAPHDTDTALPPVDPFFGTGGDVRRLPVFTDYGNTQTPGSIVWVSRQNLRPDGTIGTSDGLNPNTTRPMQVYLYPITGPNNLIARLGQSPDAVTITNASYFGAVLTTNSRRRSIFNIGSQVQSQPSLNRNFLKITPEVLQENTSIQLTFLTGASSIPVGTAPSNVPGLAPDMLGTISFTLPNTTSPITANAGNVSTTRLPAAPLELGRVTLTIDGISAGLKAINGGLIDFIVPPNAGAGVKTVVINYNGLVLRGTVNIIQAQPDVLTTQTCPCNGGGRTRILNVTDPTAPPQPEPFALTTRTVSGSYPTRLRLYLTGVQGVTASNINIRIQNTDIQPLTDAIPTSEPGVYTIDFILPQLQAIVGDVPIVVTIINSGQQSRPAASASRLRILAQEPVPNDLAVWRSSSGTWWVLDNSGNSNVAMQWGSNADIPVTGDFDGDGKTDFAVYRPDDPSTPANECAGSCTWYILRSSDNTWMSPQFGTSADKPVPADYDGDGRADVAVLTPGNIWYVLPSGNNQFYGVQYGASGDIPVASDYDGDGKADIALWRPSNGTWYVLQSSNSQNTNFAWGANGDKPVPGDYDGDGKTDYAVWQPSNNWVIRLSGNGQTKSVGFGYQASDIPVQGDYDSDGRTDVAVWRPSNGYWFIEQSRFNNSLRSVQWGITGDIPVPAPFRRR